MARANDGTGQHGQTSPRHVWVDGDLPGVLIDWRQVDGTWKAHVLWAPRPQAIAQGWIAQDRVRPR